MYNVTRMWLHLKNLLSCMTAPKGFKVDVDGHLCVAFSGVPNPYDTALEELAWHYNRVT